VTRTRWNDVVVAWKKHTLLLPSLRAVALRTTGVASGYGAGLKEYRSALNCPAQAPSRAGLFLVYVSENMERPNHLNVGKKSATSRATSIAIVVAIHVLAITGLIVALNQGALLKQLQEIKATVDTQKEIPKAPPPPPPDLVKPPPPVAIVPEFTVATAPPPPVTTAPKPPPAPPAPPRPTITNDPLRPVMRTHTIPPYPPISVRLGEQGTVLRRQFERLRASRRCGVRLGQGPLALAAPHLRGQARSRQNPRVHEVRPQGRPVKVKPCQSTNLFHTELGK